MRILITGASGFIGTNLVQELLEKKITFINLDITPPINPDYRPYWHEVDIMDSCALFEYFQTFQPTHVIHLAARTDCVETDSIDDYAVNFEGTQHVLNAIQQTLSVERAIITSTQFVCKPGYIPKHHADYAPHTIYGQSKIKAEQFTRQSNLRCVWTLVRPTNIWGPWHLRHRSQFFRALQKGYYFHPGHETVLRAYGYVGTIVYQLLKILNLPASSVHKETFYLSDPAINLYDWTNGFSNALLGRNVRVMPRACIRSIALFGDLLSVAGLEFPLTTSRFRSMTENYLPPMQATFDTLGIGPYNLDTGIQKTVMWLRNFNGASI